MSDKKRLCIIGGDARLVYLANDFARSGWTVYAAVPDKPELLDSRVTVTSVPEAIQQSGIVVLPLPISSDGMHLNVSSNIAEPILLQDLFSQIRPDQLVFGGKISPTVSALAQKFQFQLQDYLLREELAVLNAVSTAEAAISIVMQKMDQTIYSADFLITGYGRIAKILAKILIVMGARVTITARKCSDRVLAQIAGCNTIPLAEIDRQFSDTNVIINTVPALLFPAEKLEKIKSDTLVIDLASKPGGFDFNAAKEHGLEVIWALSLPGKYAPYSAGTVIAQTILHMLEERG